MKEYDKAVCCGFVLIRSMLIFLYSANCTKVNINAWGKNSHFSFYYIKQQYCIRRQYATKKKLLVSFSFSFLFSFHFFGEYEFILLARVYIYIYYFRCANFAESVFQSKSFQRKLKISIIKAFKYINRFRSCYKYLKKKNMQSTTSLSRKLDDKRGYKFELLSSEKQDATMKTPRTY